MTRLLAGIAAGIIACAGTPSSGVTPSRSTPPTVSAPAGLPNLYDAQRQVDEYIRSGRYDQDVAKVVAQARAWLEQRAPTAAKPALGDQESDLLGGYAERRFKLPNSVYHLP
jgi:hypothetical protein